MRDPDCKAVYEGMTGRRDRYLGFAQEIARYTLPTLSPKGQVETWRPYTASGTLGVRSLASYMVKVNMPAGVRWAEVDLPVEVWPVITPILGDDGAQVMRDRLKSRGGDIFESFERKRVRSRAAAAMNRILCEGSTGFFNHRGGVRVYPLRAHTVEREGGEVRFACFVDEIEPAPETIYKGQKRSQEKKCIYTCVNYETEEIWRQVDDGAAERVDDELPDQWWVTVTETPDVDDYPVPYAYNYLRLIVQIDHAEESLAEAMAIASFAPIGLKTGTPVARNPEQIRRIRSGDPLVMNDGDMFIPAWGGKLGDWSFIGAILSANREELAKIFAMGIKDRPISHDTSATAVLEIVDELNTQTQDLMTSMSETFQVPLVRSENLLLEQVTPLFPDLPPEVASLLRIVVTTGIRAVEKQRTSMQFVERVLPSLKLMDETFRVHAERIADDVSQAHMIDTKGYYSSISQDEMRIQQLLAEMAAPEQRPTGRNGAPTNGRPPRTDTIMTRGGPQPPQPRQPSRR